MPADGGSNTTITMQLSQGDIIAIAVGVPPIVLGIAGITVSIWLASKKKASLWQRLKKSFR